MNVKVFKDAVTKKCKQCVGPYSGRYDATPAELIDVCDKQTCGLWNVRPRIKSKEVVEFMRDVLND